MPAVRHVHSLTGWARQRLGWTIANPTYPSHHPCCKYIFTYRTH
uniref:Uncharacterized protein n=1 Tax=Anguilla anguilla TaxID=7936 RepID=A0A0E9RCR9_ANGAN